MQSLKISFFGPFTLEYGDKLASEAGTRGHKQWRLIKYLILNRERRVGRRELIDATFGYGVYFGESEKALNALNAIIHRARQMLEKSGIPIQILYSEGKYTVGLFENTEIDCEIFSALSDAILSESGLDGIKEKSIKALGVYGGFFLDSSYFDEKTKLLAEKYHTNYRRIFSRLCGIWHREGSYASIVEMSRRACKIDPLCEDFRIEYISALISLGDVDGAKNAYFDALSYLGSKTSAVISSDLRVLGEKLECQGETVVLLPKEHADRADLAAAALSKELNGSKIKILLV